MTWFDDLYYNILEVVEILEIIWVQFSDENWPKQYVTCPKSGSISGKVGNGIQVFLLSFYFIPDWLHLSPWKNQEYFNTLR